MSPRRCALLALLVASACVEVPEIGETERPVINGDPTPDGHYPATGALLADLGRGFLEPSCTGSLIAPNAVLTAAHCLDPLFIGSQTPSFTLRHDANLATDDEIIAGLSNHQHPDFDLAAQLDPGVSKWNDVAVLLLAEEVATPELAVLPDPEEVTEMIAGLDLEIVGYGLTSDSAQTAGVKHHGVASLVQVGDHELLISEPGQQQNCRGDSGGPAYVDLGRGPRIVGVVSRSPDDDPVCDHGGVDTRVDAYLEFIHSIADVPCGGLEEPCECVGEMCDEGGGCCSTGTGDPTGAALLALAVLLAVGRRRSARPANARAINDNR